MLYRLWATAGHIDHGKSALLRALTGHDPDRLPEEKARGITIDLGFVHFDGDGASVSFIDVPGHEGFVRNMLAGVGGVDAVALVVACDESVMPQTLEHFDIARLLGIRHGLVALTKAGLADADMRAAAREEVQALVRGSFLEGAPMLEVDSISGEGLSELRAALLDISRQIPERPARGVFRLPVDRAFSIRGFGTVVTGTAMGGRLAEGRELELQPSGKRLRVRGIQVHGKAVKEARAGQRTALNVHGAEVAEIRRGDMLAEAEALRPSQALDLRVTLLPGAGALRPGARLRFHHAAGEYLGRLRALPGEEAAPGAEFLARIRLEEPCLAAAGDRFILRSYSPAHTIGGGMVLEPFPFRREKREAAARALHELAEEISAAALTAASLRRAGERGLSLASLTRRTALKAEEIRVLAAGMNPPPAALGGRFMDAAAFAALSKKTESALAAFHAKNPLQPGMPKEALRREAAPGLPPEAFETLLKILEKEGKTAAGPGGVRAASFKPALDTAQDALAAKVETAFRRAGLAPPTPRELIAPFGKEGDEMLKHLMREGKILRVASDYAIHADAYAALLEKLRALSARKPLWGVADFKQLTGLSRKHAIPLLEFLDKNGATAREGDSRRLKS